MFATSGHLVAAPIKPSRSHRRLPFDTAESWSLGGELVGGTVASWQVLTPEAI
jgi:hypothetical protein